MANLFQPTKKEKAELEDRINK
uniref:Uncharacterized protein n=1 Tax=Vitis vinifera TaxID=29760 RepID=F6H3Y2_VITVI